MKYRYFDYNATTPLLPTVKAEMFPFFDEIFGNPSSRHLYGRKAKEAIEESRHIIASCFGAYPEEVVFTSGGTEANHLALWGLTQNQKQIVVFAGEHPSVLEAAKKIATHRRLPIHEVRATTDGNIDCKDLQQALQKPTQWLAVMHANNETGSIYPLSDIAALTRDRHILLHSDWVQAACKMPLDFHKSGVTSASLSAHKFGGPKGVGALLLRREYLLEPWLCGGGQEHGYRAGTENVAAIVGFAKACAIASANLDTYQTHTKHLRDLFETGIKHLNGIVFAQKHPRIANTSYFALPGIQGEMAVMRLDQQGFAVASGAACSSSKSGPSHVLLAMDIAADLAQSAIRVSFGMAHQEEDVQELLLALETLQQEAALILE
jgi:cysteine desulfurase